MAAHTPSSTNEDKPIESKPADSILQSTDESNLPPDTDNASDGDVSI